MDGQWTRIAVAWLLLPGALLLLGLTVFNAWFSLENEALTEQLLDNQRIIDEGLRLSRINTQVIKGIAGVSVQTEDTELRLLLARHGITFAQQGANSQSNETNKDL